MTALPQTLAIPASPRDGRALPPAVGSRGNPILPAALLVLTAAAAPIVMDAIGYAVEIKRCAASAACLEGMVR